MNEGWWRKESKVSQTESVGVDSEWKKEKESKIEENQQRNRWIKGQRDRQRQTGRETIIVVHRAYSFNLCFFSLGGSECHVLIYSLIYSHLLIPSSLEYHTDEAVHLFLVREQLTLPTFAFHSRWQCTEITMLPPPLPTFRMLICVTQRWGEALNELWGVCQCPISLYELIISMRLLCPLLSSSPLSEIVRGAHTYL